MITQEIINSLKKAYKDLFSAENELSRPKEDVVTLSACQSVRNSMKQIMELYLSAHDIPFDPKGSMSGLLDKCVIANQAFVGVNITNIECRSDNHKDCNGKYCLSVEAVTHCLTAANRLKDLIWWEFKITD